MALGASGAWIGTRFLASEEVAIHPHYRERLFQATEDDTVYLDELFDIGWPKAPHRVLRNRTVENWEAAGRSATGKRPGEGEVVATSKSRGPIVRYRSYTPAADADGDIDALSLWVLGQLSWWACRHQATGAQDSGEKNQAGRAGAFAVSRTVRRLRHRARTLAI
jgi:NAD(P)H-dependent flavin oxidoreductase YrpB (nitropropane dioxygenase family)